MTLRGDRVLCRLPIATCAIAALTIFVSTSTAAADRLQFDRAALASGELWRFWTGHLAHWSGEQLAWDLGMFVCLGATIERSSRARLAGLLALSTSAVSACILLLTSFGTYRGLSGVDAALFVAVSMELARDRSRLSWIGTAALLIFLLKISVEVIIRRSIFVVNLAPGIGNVPLAHLTGAATAVAFGWVPRILPSGRKALYVCRRVSGFGGLS
jgi:rhomboid family GlyGly-CTERM serine protease